MAFAAKGQGGSFSVFIGANATQLTRTLAELQKDLAGFKKQLSTATNAQDVIKLNQAIAQTDRAIKSISGAQSLGALNTGLARLPAGAGQATTALTNMGRVVSDAPFGFIAISNNVDPLIQSFIQLKAQTGSTQGALKALGSSLIGGGGLALAFSLATAAITYYSTRTAFAKDETEGLAKAQADANKEAGAQIANLRTLAAVAGNTANAAKERKQAAEQLSKALKEQNVQLTIEEALNNKAAAAIDTATQAILARAKARAIENRVAELSAKGLDRELKREDFLKRLSTLQQKYNKDLAQEQKALEGTGETARGDIELETRIRELQTAIKELDTETVKANAEIDNLLTKVTTAPTTGGGSDVVVDLLKKRIDALKQLRDEVGLTRNQQIELGRLEVQLIKRDAIKAGFTREEMEDRINATIQKLFPNEQVTSRLKIRIIGELDSTEVSKDIEKIKSDVAGRTLTGINLFGIVPADINAVVKALQDAAKAKNELLNTDKAKEFADFIVSQLGPAFTDLFDGIVSGGGDAFKNFAKMIGDVIKRLLAAAAAAFALSTILGAIFPGLGFGGKAGFQAIFGKLSGLNIGGTSGINAGGAFAGNQGAVLSQARMTQTIGQAGSGNNTGGNFTARIVDGGRDLLLIMQREQRSFNRKF